MTKNLLLLVEDNPLLTEMYRVAFEKAGFTVVFAHDGETGLALAKDKQPQGIILDLLMPGMDGFEVLAKLKDSQTTKDIKVIVLTSVTDKKELERAKSLGALDCLIKSELALSEIVERIRSYFTD